MEQALALTLPLAAFNTMELVIILAVVLLLFGARKLPALAESMGASISSFKRGMKSGTDAEAPDSAKAPESKRPTEHDAAKH